jgi:hypothetical protein
MEIREIKISPLFERHYRKLPKRLKKGPKGKKKFLEKTLSIPD